MSLKAGQLQYDALERARIENFRWHDLRHTWASWHVQKGTPLVALQELGGWESAQMVRRYAHLSASIGRLTRRGCARRAQRKVLRARFGHTAEMTRA